MSFCSPTHIAIVSLWAKDVPATAHFYRDVIGLQLLSHDSHHSERPHFDLNGTLLTILKGDPVPAHNPEPPHFPLLALAVEDLELALERLRDQRVELPWGVEEGTNSRWVKFFDPAGNLIELVQFK